MQNTIAARRTASSITILALALATLGLAISAPVAPAEAGKVGDNKISATAGSQPVPNPVVRDHRDHRQLVCGRWAKTSDDCRKRPSSDVSFSTSGARFPRP